MEISIEEMHLKMIARFANGDARTALNTLEMAVLNGEMDEAGKIRVNDEVLAQCMNRRSLLYDKNGEEHYNGEEPLYIARRLVRFASEDVGMADSQALPLAVSVYQACHFLGMPECDVHLTHAVVYLSMAPKSNALYMACEACKKDVRELPAEPVPLQICNAPTGLMKELNYGKDYVYAHDTEEKLSRMKCLPESLDGRRYYLPTEEGDEGKVKEKLIKILQWKSQE